MTLGGGAYDRLPSNTVVAALPYLDAVGFRAPVRTYLYAISAALQPGEASHGVNVPGVRQHDT